MYNQSIINSDFLDSLRITTKANNPLLIRNIVSLYIKSFEEKINSIRQLFISNNLVKLKKEIHTLKGESYNVGSIKIPQTLEHLESLKFILSENDFKKEIDNLSILFKIYKIEIEKYLNYYEKNV